MQPVPPAGILEPVQNQRKDKAPKKGIKLNTPLVIGYMSVDVLREYHHDLSQLKYLTSIPEGQTLYYDLNHNIDKAVKRTIDENDEKISLLLKFILDQKNRLKALIVENRIFICYRRSLISVMCNLVKCTPVSIVASLFNNSIYLCTFESPQEILKRQSCREEDKFRAWGYKFEQYMLSATPESQPDIQKPVVENEEFSIYYYSCLGKHRLFYGARIDGMLADQDPAIKIPEGINDVQANLNFLRNNQFVELETHKELSSLPHMEYFKKYQLLRCWCQCFLAGLKGLLMGYRNEDGIIREVEWKDTRSLYKDTLGPRRMTDFLNSFLNFVNESFRSEKATLGVNYDPKVPLTLKIDIDEQHRFSVCKTDEEAHIILPSWYIDNIKEES